MIKITTWKPDTCECEIHYQWDDSVPEDQRVHVPIDSFTDSQGKIRQTKKCQHHNKHDLHTAHAKILEENQGKNFARQHILDSLPEVADVKTDADGNQVKEFKKGNEFSFSFDENRQLQVEVKGLNAKNKTDLRTALGAKFGNGKIKIA